MQRAEVEALARLQQSFTLDELQGIRALRDALKPTLEEKSLAELDELHGEIQNSMLALGVSLVEVRAELQVLAARALAVLDLAAEREKAMRQRFARQGWSR